MKAKKENEAKAKKDFAEEAMKVRCKVCFKEVAPKRMCGGHGSGTGGDEKETSENDLATEDDSLSSTLNALKKENESSQDTLVFEDFDDLEHADALFDAAVIQSLVDKKLLSIELDREEGTLSIRLKCAPEMLSQKEQTEFKKFTNTILKEWETFRKEHALSDRCLKIQKDAKGHVLEIHVTLPSEKLFDAFVNQLSQNVVPTPKPLAQKAEEKTEKSTFNPSPFSTLLKPRK